MEARQEKGLAIARTNIRMKRDPAGKWLVPSQSISAFYFVDTEAGTCTCPDFETRRATCKHQFAVQYVRYRATRPDGSTVEATVRVTYARNWALYNDAQMHEKERVGTLLRALCDGIVQPKQEGRGRPRLALADVTHAAAMKVYTTLSGRRADTDVREAEAKGLITHAPHYNSIHGFIENAEMTPLLKVLVEESAQPLRAIESEFAIDSTGFATSVYARWFDEKYGRPMKKQSFVKAHAMVGVRTNVITAVEVTDKDQHDSPQLPGLLAATARRFDMKAVSADKAYLSHHNLDLIEAVGAVPYIPFKINSRAEGPAAWRRLWDLFNYRREEFLTHYHLRSNSEATFSAVKRLFGGAVRAKLPAAMANEVILKCLVWNATRLVHAINQFKIDPSFWGVTLESAS